MITFSFFPIMFVFAFFICGCNKDDDNNKFDDLTPIEIEEIVYCQPDLSNTDLQAKFAIKTKGHSVITYEYADVEMNATSCILYYDEIKKQGVYMVFSQNKMTQFIVSSQNKLNKFVCETEIIGSSIFIRGYEYDWDNGEITLLGEYTDVIPSTAKQAQLRNANDNTDKVATEGVQNMLHQYNEALRKGGQGISKTMGGVNGEFIESASKNTHKTIERTIKINNDTKILADDFWNKRLDKAIAETWDNTTIWIVDNAEDLWDKIAPPIKNVGKAFYDHFAGGLKTAAENIKNFINNIGKKWGFTISQRQSGNCTNYGDVKIIVYDYIGNMPINGFSTQQECEQMRSIFSGISESYGNCTLYIHCTPCELQ